jgi:hypothetical protein
MASSLPQHNNKSNSPNAASSELCPSCGQFTDERGLSEHTGWCFDCSDTIVSVRTSSSDHAIETHADAIEYFMQTAESGLSVWRALELARQDRPRCVVCGEEIRRSRRSAIFCRRHPLCRRYSRRYVYLYTRKKDPMSKAQALATVLSQLTGE